jgi:hypothetical protein
MKRTLSFLLCLLLAACNLPEQPAASAPQAWFDMPLPDTVFYPPNPCHLIAHGASPNGIAAFEVYANGAFAFTEPLSDSKQTLAVLDTICPRLIAGKNLIHVRAQDSSGIWSDFAQTTVFLVEERIPDDAPPPLSTETPAAAYTAIPTLTATLPPTSTPTETPTPQPTGGVTVERVSTNLVYLGESSCGTNEVTILARATAPNGIKVVVLFYRFATGNSSSEFQSLGMKSIGGDLYEATLNPTSLLGGVPFEQATLQYQVVVQQNDGDTSIRTPVLADIVVQACGRVTVSCSSFTEQRACIANGCNWVEIPGVVPIYECRSP